VTGFLRYIGILNAAVWLGASIFFTFGIAPAAFSAEMQNLIGANNYPYFSGAIAQILVGRYFILQLICGIVAFLHMLTEWLYLGKTPRKLWLGLLIGLFAIALIGGDWLQPKLKDLHWVKYRANQREQREIASQSFRAWHGAAQILNLVALVGLGLYLWRVANPPDPTRFVSTTKFRS
jgi:hypothetical protein